MVKKGNIPWNKGLRNVQKSTQKGRTFEEIYGIEKATTLKLQHSQSMRGRHCSPLTEFKKGRHYNPAGEFGKNAPWNKGKSGVYSEDTIRKIASALQGKTGNKRGYVTDDITKKRISYSVIKWLNNPVNRSRLQTLAVRRPNNSEKYLDAILQLNFPHEWRYTGDFAFWVENRNPDFVNCNGTKAIIEFDGYWHKRQSVHDTHRNMLYKKYGYSLLILTEPDLNSESLVETIKKFTDNAHLENSRELHSAEGVDLRRRANVETTLSGA